MDADLALWQERHTAEQLRSALRWRHETPWPGGPKVAAAKERARCRELIRRLRWVRALLPAEPIACPHCGAAASVGGWAKPIPTAAYDHEVTCSEACHDGDSFVAHGATREAAIAEWNAQEVE